MIEPQNPQCVKTVSTSPFFEGENIIAFDNEAWNKVGKDVGDNSCYY